MAKHIEGIWKDFYFRPVVSADIPKILEHLTNNLHRDEVLSTLIPPDEEYIRVSNERIAKNLEGCLDLCFIALERSTGNIGGLQFCFKWRRADALAVTGDVSTKLEERWGSKDVPKLRIIQELLFEPLEKPKMALFDDHEEIVWNWLVSVDRGCRHQGLATEMFKRMVEFLKKEQLPLVFSIYTSPFSRRCAQKMGFKEIAAVKYKAIKNPKGHPLLPNAKLADGAALMALNLSEDSRD